MGLKRRVKILNVFKALITSRKLGKKKHWSFSHYGFFDHPDLQSLNECNFFFDLPTEILRIWGLLIYR
jgi:hypothetical protein